MENDSLKSTTSVNISSPNVEADKISKKLFQAIACESTLKHQLLKDGDSIVIQINHMKAAAESFKFLLDEREKILYDLKVGLRLLRQSLISLDYMIEAASGQVEETRAEDLDLLRYKIKRAEEREKDFNLTIFDCRRTVGNIESMLADWESVAWECKALKRLYDIVVRNTKASFKELNNEQKLAIDEHVNLSKKRKFQLDEMKRRKDDFFHMRNQYEQIAAERTKLNEHLKKLDARLLGLEELAKWEPESPALLKIEGSKKNVALRSKQILDATTQRAQKKLDKPKSELTNINLKRNFKNMMTTRISQPIDIANSPIILQSPDGQNSLRQTQDSMPKLDGPVTKFYEQRGNGQVLEQVGVAGAATNFTTQTLSKVATDSNPANYHVETQQMQMNRPGFDSNSDCTTKFRKVVYSGRGIDMNVMNEAKRILEIHQQGVTREADETEEEFKLRKVLVKRAADQQKMMENSEFAQNSLPSGQVLETEKTQSEEEMSRVQAVFAQIMQWMTHK